mgnify:CR=1 FL=1
MSLFGDIAGLAAINAAYNKLGQVGTSAQSAANALAGQLETKAAFKPFTVTTGTGTGGITSAGGITMMPTGSAATLQSNLLSRGLADLIRPVGAGDVSTLGLGMIDDVQAELGRDLPTLGITQQVARDNLTAARGLIREAEMDPAAREQAIFQRIRAAQAPEEERQRLALEERLQSQGRLGVATNLYGGTPEQLALAKAQAEAQNTAMIQAMGQAQAERQMAGQLGTQFSTTGAGLGAAAEALRSGRQAMGLQLAQGGLGLLTGREALEAARLQQGLAATKAAFIPEASAQNAFQQALRAAELRQQAQQFGTGLFGESTMTGIDALLASGLGQASLMGNVGAGVLAAAAQSDDGGLFDLFKDLFG